MFVTILRTSKFALQHFWRNLWISAITVFILTLTLFIVSLVGSLNLLAGQAIKAVEEKVDLLALIPGSATEKIKKGTKNYIEGKSLKDAVKKVFSLAKKGDVVVLSPASASFNMFANEFDRGRQFISEVKKL